MTLFDWLRSILHHAKRIGRFWYSLPESRRAVDLVLEDKSVASVTSATADAERGDETDTMAEKFVTLYQITPQPPDDTRVVAPADDYADNYHDHEEKGDDRDEDARRSGLSPELPSPFD